VNRFESLFPSLLTSSTAVSGDTAALPSYQGHLLSQAIISNRCRRSSSSRDCSLSHVLSHRSTSLVVVYLH